MIHVAALVHGNAVALKQIHVMDACSGRVNGSIVV